VVCKACHQRLTGNPSAPSPHQGVKARRRVARIPKWRAKSINYARPGRASPAIFPIPERNGHKTLIFRVIAPLIPALIGAFWSDDIHICFVPLSRPESAPHRRYVKQCAHVTKTVPMGLSLQVKGSPNRPEKRLLESGVALGINHN